jgi:hypothetical protein
MLRATTLITSDFLQAPVEQVAITSLAVLSDSHSLRGFGKEKKKKKSQIQS